MKKFHSKLEAMRPISFALSLALAWILLAACQPLMTPLPPLPTEVSPPTPTATATTVWFPPTATPTSLPTPGRAITPTLDLSPRYGGLIFGDAFTDTQAWSQGRVPAGNIAQGLDELTLSVSQPRGYLFSLREEPTLGDFYAEITASPTICRGEDQYGLLIRVTSPQDLFRFGLSCDGRARVERLFQGQASAPQPPTYSGAVPLGAPSQSRLAVWLRGREMRFYANNEHLFSVSDPSIPVGLLGVYVRAAGEDMVTVNFSDLQVYQLNE